MRVSALRERFGTEPVSAYLNDGWRLLELPVGAVAYHRVGRTAITVGAPLSPGADATAATAAFRDHCRRQRMRPVVFQSAAPVDGMRSYLVAREAFIEVEQFTLAGSRMANVRHSVTRARRDGVSVSWLTWGACPLSLRRQVLEVSRAWSGMRPELTFTYGRVDEIPEEALVGLARGAGGRLEAVSTWRRLPAAGGLVLDLIRRRNDAAAGAVELLVAEGVEFARQRGLRWLSLGAVCQLDGLPGWLRLALASAEACGRPGLVCFKEKFAPRWEDRYLALPAGPGAAIGLAALGLAHLRGVNPKAVAVLRPQRRLRRPALRWAAAAAVAVGLMGPGLAAAAQPGGSSPTAAIQPVLRLLGAGDGQTPDAGSSSPTVAATAAVDASAEPGPTTAKQDVASNPAATPAPPTAKTGERSLASEPRPDVTSAPAPSPKPGTPLPGEVRHRPTPAREPAHREPASHRHPQPGPAPVPSVFPQPSSR